MAIVRHCFPQCDECEKIDSDLWAFSNKLALAGALTHRWRIIDNKLNCPECADKKNKNLTDDYLRSKSCGISSSSR
jgi:hypothetical protein